MESRAFGAGIRFHASDRDVPTKKTSFREGERYVREGVGWGGGAEDDRVDESAAQGAGQGAARGAHFYRASPAAGLVEWGEAMRRELVVGWGVSDEDVVWMSLVM